MNGLVIYFLMMFYIMHYKIQINFHLQYSYYLVDILIIYLVNNNVLVSNNRIHIFHILHNIHQNNFHKNIFLMILVYNTLPKIFLNYHVYKYILYKLQLNKLLLKYINSIPWSSVTLTRP